MVSGVNEKELFRYLGLLSDEVLEIHKTLEAIGSREAGVRAALGDLALEKELLIEQTNRLETIVKQTATSAIVDAELEREHQQSIASEKVSLQAQIMDMEESLRAQETQVKELQEQFTAKIEDLHDQIREKDSLLEVRAMAMNDLKNAADCLNRLVSGLSSNGAAPAVRSDEPQDDLKGETPGATNGN